MKIVTFYLLNKHDTKNSKITNTETLACKIIIKKWQEGKNVAIACIDKQQAIKMNQILWTNNKNRFIPHSIIDQKKTINNSKIHIYYSPHHIKTTSYNTILINMTISDIQFSYYFNNIIEFVPYETHLKKWARKKYKKYLKDKAQLITVKIKK